MFQFKQLEGRSLKNIRASMGFEPVTSALHWCDLRCTVAVIWLFLEGLQEESFAQKTKQLIYLWFHVSRGKHFAHGSRLSSFLDYGWRRTNTPWSLFAPKSPYLFLAHNWLQSENLSWFENIPYNQEDTINEFCQEGLPILKILGYLGIYLVQTWTLWLIALKAGKIENEKLKVETELAKLSR